MNRFPRKGDFVKLEKQFSVNLGDLGNGNIYLDIPKDSLLEILAIDMHPPHKNSYIDIVPYELLVGIADPKIFPKPIIVKFSYEIHSSITTIIPGDNPQAIEILYGKSS